jgi:hypothetical protein
MAIENPIAVTTSTSFEDDLNSALTRNGAKNLQKKNTTTTNTPIRRLIFFIWSVSKYPWLAMIGSTTNTKIDNISSRIRAPIEHWAYSLCGAFLDFNGGKVTIVYLTDYIAPINIPFNPVHPRRSDIKICDNLYSANFK